MASSNEEPGGKTKVDYGRRFFWFALAIVAAGVLYSAFWNYAAGRLVEKADAAVASLNGNGRRAHCENAEARGYPFRLGVFCRSVMFEDARAGVSFRAQALRSAAQVYQPFHVVGELDGPAALEAPGLAAPLELRWASLRSSVRLASPLPERVSVEGRDVEARRDEAGDADPLLGTMDTIELHMRPTEGGIELAMRFFGLAPDAALTGSAVLPPLSGLVDLFIEEGGPGLRGRRGMVRTVTLSTDPDTGATLTGPVSVDAQGLVDAELQLTLRDPRALAAILGDLFPDYRQEIELSLGSLASTGEAPTVPLRIAGGEVRLGFLVLGTIPPL